MLLMNTHKEEEDEEEDDNVNRMETDITDEEMARRWERKWSQSDGIVQEPKTLIIICFFPQIWKLGWEHEKKVCQETKSLHNY